MLEARVAITPQALAAAVVQRLYGFRPTALKPLGAGRHVSLAEFGGLPAKIVKLAGDVRGVQREQKILRALRRPRWRMPVPALELTERDLPPQWTIGGKVFHRPAAVSILRHEPGMSLADAILRGEPWAGEAMHAAGAFAARLACLPLGALLRCRSLPGGAPAVLAHGALSVSTILVEAAAAGPRLCVLDWTGARAAAPAFDLDCLIDSLARLPLTDPGLIAFLRRRAIDGFRALRPESAEAPLAPPGRFGLRPANVAVP